MKIFLQGLKIETWKQGKNGKHLISNWNHWGGMQWKLFGCLALSWALICLCLINGISSYGKLTYFVSLFPYAVLITLLAYVATLDGFKVDLEFQFLDVLQR